MGCRAGYFPDTPHRGLALVRNKAVAGIAGDGTKIIQNFPLKHAYMLVIFITN